VQKINELISEKKEVQQSDFNSYYEYYTYCVQNCIKMNVTFFNDFHVRNCNNK